MPPRPPPLQPGEPQDAFGAATLERLAAAPRYNRWMFDRLRRWVGTHVLEIGSGIGNLSDFLLDRERVVLTDTEPYYLARLREKYAGRANVEIARLYLPTVDGALADERFDTIICLNVLEHVRDDERSLAVMRALLRPGGHHRRYTPRELAHKFAAAGLALRHREYFNLAGILGWWFTGRVLRRRLIPAASLALYDALVPVFRLERFLPWRLGQSLIAIGERP